MIDRAPTDEQLALGAQVERALIDEWRGKSSRSEIRFNCPLGSHSSDRPASYNRVDLVWQCFACGASGGLTWGAIPLAPTVGIGEPSASGLDLTKLRARREQIQAEAAAADERKAEALADYWREQRLADELRRHDTILAQLEREGCPRMAAEHFGFGWTMYGAAPSLTIPWTLRGEIRALQYRILVGQPVGGRYRWHKGSKPTLFNADTVVEPHDDTIIVVEGAKKAAALWGHGITSTCAVVNKGGWRPEFAPPFARFARVVFALDPDAWRDARDAALTVPGARVARLPSKPDDMLVETGGDVDLLWHYIEKARAA